MNEPIAPAPAVVRLTSIDAYRGFVMFLMMAEVLHLAAVAKALPDSDVWKTLSWHQQHVEWVGCSLHDLIQPSFSFLVGVALPFSLASRAVRGQSRARVIAHALWRALILGFLGVFLRSMASPRTNFTFEDTLTQIGLGYPFLFLLGLRPRRDQAIALVVILVGYWALFATYPAPDPAADQPGAPANWPYRQTGFAAHWNKNSNPASDFDRWLLNRFPRSAAFVGNAGGYATLSFIPTLGTMILGLFAGEVLRSERSKGAKVGRLVAAGVVGLAAGYALGWLGVCPVVKRIWTPSWVLFSGGWCFLLMAAFYTTLDATAYKGWAFPLVVIGMNSIAAYVMSLTIKGFVSKSLDIHLGKDVFLVLGEPYAGLLHGAAVLLVLWLILFWMYRRRLFLRI
jgi:heparan-alpha-glucosaminide N-acetyltransferase